MYAYNHTCDSSSFAIRPPFGMKRSGLNSNVSLLNGAVPATVWATSTAVCTKHIPDNLVKFLHASLMNHLTNHTIHK
jgi:hypothetical protein